MTFPCYHTSCRKRHNKASTGFCTCKGTLPPKDVQPNLKEKPQNNNNNKAFNCQTVLTVKTYFFNKNVRDYRGWL